MEAEVFTEVAVILAAAVSVGVAVAAGMVAVTAGGAVVMDGREVGIEEAGMVAADTGTEVVRIGMVALPIGGGITHTVMGITVGKLETKTNCRWTQIGFRARGALPRLRGRPEPRSVHLRFVLVLVYNRYRII